MDSTPIIGLAGGIGSGKSTVARLLAEHGCVVADSDAAARQSLDDPEIRRRIVERWGDRILDRDGRIDRSDLAAIVFSDADERTALEEIVHPWVEQQRVEQFASANADGGPPVAFVIDAPLLFEAGLDRECDAVIFVDAPREVRMERVKESRGWDAEELEKRERSQMALDEKRRLADHVVHNSGTLADLDVQVRGILATIVASHRGSRS